MTRGNVLQKVFHKEWAPHKPMQETWKAKRDEKVAVLSALGVLVHYRGKGFYTWSTKVNAYIRVPYRSLLTVSNLGHVIYWIEINPIA